MNIFSRPHVDDLSEVSIDGGVHLVVIVVALISLFKARLSKTTHQAIQGEIQDNLNRILDPLINKANDASCLTREVVREGTKVAKVIGSTGYENGHNSKTSIHNNFLFAMSIFVTSKIILIFALIIAMIRKHQVHTPDVCDLVERLNPNSTNVDTSNGPGQANNNSRSGNVVEATVDLKQCQEFKIHTKAIVVNSVITLLVVAVYEAVFIMRIAIHYIPVKASVLIDAALDRAKMHAKRIDCISHRCPCPSRTIDPPSRVADPLCEIAWKLALSLSIAGISGFALASLHRATRENSITHNLLPVKTKVADAFETIGTPVVSALVIGMTVTFVYFTSAEAVEGRQVKRQVERTVDAAFERYEAAMTVVSDDDADKYNHYVAESVYALKAPDTTATQKEIDKRNAVYIKCSNRMVALAGVLAFIIVISGMIFSGRKGSSAKRQTALRYLCMAITSASLGASISFIAEYAFLQAIVSNFEAADPSIAINRAIQRAVDRVGDGCGKQ